MFRTCAVSGCLTALLAASSAAQVITGRIIAADNVTPVSGVVIVAADSTGQSARALSGATGEFSIAIPRPGRYTVHLYRIGFRPLAHAPVDVSDSGLHGLTLVAPGEVVLLSSLRSQARSSSCRIASDSGLAIARVWEQGRIAMLSVGLSAESPPIIADWIEFDRTLATDGRHVRHQSTRLTRAPTTHAFTSPNPELLHSQGYVVQAPDGVQFFAPDAAVLLSDDFANDHCFEIVGEDKAHPSAIGIAFHPNDSRSGVPDIDGVAWLEKASAELQEVKFEYVNLPDAVRAARPGGDVSFKRMPRGGWIISAWQARFPVLQPHAAISDGGARRRVYSSSDLDLVGMQVTGGIVSRVRDGGVVVYESPGASPKLRFISRDTLVPASGVELTLEGTDFRGVSDSAGTVEIPPILDGDFVLKYRLGLPVPLRDIVFEGEIAPSASPIDSIFLPTADEIARRVCGKSVGSRSGLLIGTIEDTRPRRSGTPVILSWQEPMQDSTGSSHTERTREATVDSAGHWWACGVPRQTIVTASISRASGVASNVATIPPNQAWRMVNLAIPSEPAKSAASFGTTPPDQRLEITVLDEGGLPIPGVELSLLKASTLQQRASTDSAGRIVVTEIDSGLTRVTARKLGFVPGAIDIRLGRGTTRAPIILSRTAPPLMDTVRVLATANTDARAPGFEERRRDHIAALSLDETDIRGRNAIGLSQLLVGVPSLSISQAGGRVSFESTRGAVFERGKLAPCRMVVVVDGIALNPSGEEVQAAALPRPGDIHALEVFAGGATLPPNLAVLSTYNRCGMVVVWTR